jgi:osmotically-inducible protein OsmY
MASTMADLACDRAKQALLASSIFVLRELQVEREGSNLVLSGKVDSFYHKQMAQEIVRAVARGVNLVNQVDVRPGAAGPGIQFD